jgi:hypothetical protein
MSCAYATNEASVTCGRDGATACRLAGRRAFAEVFLDLNRAIAVPRAPKHPFVVHWWIKQYKPS